MSSELSEKEPNQRIQNLTKRPYEPEDVCCPRCDSKNTKFCYYNNYNLTQPRYLCKSCRRYWTRGGTLRNVPVGGHSRKSSSKKCPRTSPSPTPAAPSSSSSTLTTPVGVGVNLNEADMAGGLVPMGNLGFGFELGIGSD